MDYKIQGDSQGNTSKSNVHLKGNELEARTRLAGNLQMDIIHN